MVVLRKSKLNCLLINYVEKIDNINNYYDEIKNLLDNGANPNIKTKHYKEGALYIKPIILQIFYKYENCINIEPVLKLFINHKKLNLNDYEIEKRQKMIIKTPIIQRINKFSKVTFLINLFLASNKKINWFLPKLYKKNCWYSFLIKSNKDFITNYNIDTLLYIYNSVGLEEYELETTICASDDIECPYKM